MEKDGEKQEFEFDLSIKGGLKAVKKLKQLTKEKWRLLDVEGDNPQIVAYLKSTITQYDTDPDHFKASPIEIVKMSKNLVKDEVAGRKKEGC